MTLVAKGHEELSASNTAVGDVREQVVVENLTRTQIVMYAGASGDFHPCHSDEPFVKHLGMERGVFAHGMLTMALTGKIVTNWVRPDRLLRFSSSFRAQVWPGDTLTARATVSAFREENSEPVVDLALETRNQHGDVVLSGSASATIDP